LIAESPAYPGLPIVQEKLRELEATVAVSHK